MIFTLSKGTIQALNLTYRLFQPQDSLKPYVKFLWTLDSENGFHSDFERFLPDGCAELVFNYKVCPKLATNNMEETLPTSFVQGQIKKPVRIVAASGIGMVGARFFPFGIRKFLKLPISELNNKTLSTHFLFGNTTKIEETFCQEVIIENKVKVLETFLTDKLLPDFNSDYMVQDCVQKIIGSNGNIEVANLRKRIRISDRHLERRFSEIIGITPKTLQRITRFQYVLGLAHQKKIRNMGTLSLDLGYYDHAHFTKEFRQFSGLCPQKFFSDCHPLLPDLSP